MRIKTLVAAAALLFTGLLSSANAAPIIYTLSGTADGTVGTTAFTNSAFTWTLVSDTSVVSNSGIFVAAIANFDTINLAGFGTLTPTTVSAYFGEPGFGVGAFFVFDIGEGVQFGSPALIGYNGKTSIGPIPVAYIIDTAVPTDMGDFVFFPTSLMTFQAVAAPEPLTLTLFGAGLAGIGAARRRQPKA